MATERAEQVKVEWDEEGCVLQLDTDDDFAYSFVITDPAEFYRRVRFAIEPFMREQKAARREAYNREEDGYELSDPKHPTYHDRFADLADLND